MRRATFACLAFVVMAPLGAQGDGATDPAVLVAQLAGGDGAAAHARLVAAGAAAVPALVAGLRLGSTDARGEVLAVLTEIGPDAAAAVPALWDSCKQLAPELAPAALWTLSELLPYAEQKEFDEAGTMELLLVVGVRAGQQALGAAMRRLYDRGRFPPQLDVPGLLQIAGGCRAFRIELAVERLGRAGGRARDALPVLAAILERPDPLVLTTDRKVPLRRKAALAILQIAPERPEAVRAREVLAGAPPSWQAPQLPERARARVAELVGDLGIAARREAAATNLVALGALAAPALAAALPATRDDDTLAAMLDVLRELGPAAASATPQLFDLLLAAPIEHTVAIARALAATAPWSRDAAPEMYWRRGGKRLEILGRSVSGDATVPLLSELWKAHRDYGVRMRVDPASTLPELQLLLDDRDVLVRLQVLELLRARGPTALPALREIARRLDESGAVQHVLEYTNGGAGGRSIDLDRSDDVRRAAARAVLAIAAADDPLAARAAHLLASLRR